MRQIHGNRRLTIEPIACSASDAVSFLTMEGLNEALVTLIMHPSPIFRLLYCIERNERKGNDEFRVYGATHGRRLIGW
jgi:hypothetical protein